MKKILTNAYLAFGLVCLIVVSAFALPGCSTTGTTAGGVAQVGTVADNQKLAINVVTAARQISTAAMTAGKITPAQDIANQAKLDQARTLIQAATTIAAVQAAQATAQAIQTNPGATTP